MKVMREDFSVSLQEKGLALDATQKKCQELEDRLQEAEADKERLLGEKGLGDQAASREAEELKVKAEQEFLRAR